MLKSWHRQSLTIKDQTQERAIFLRRAIVIAVAMVLLFGALLYRYFHLQVIEHTTYALLSESNRVHLEPVAPPRGIIYDRNGVALADNQPTFTLVLNQRELEGKEAVQATLQKLVPIFNLAADDIAQVQKRIRNSRAGDPVPVKLRLSEDEISRYAVDRHHLPGVSLEVELSRHYPHGELFAHALGYVSRINEKEMQALDQVNYAGTQLIGKNGIEKFYEDALHGKVGYQHVETNAHGQAIRVLKRQPPVPGDALTLHLDYTLQKIAHEQLAGRRGAIVAVEPATGGILAFVSNPSFDPNPFVGGIPAPMYRALRDNPDQPLYNRALQGQYPPGSTIKPFHGMAGLESGLIDWEYRISDPGVFHLPGDSHQFRDWKKGGHGIVDLNNAVMQSCDIFFYTLGGRLQVDRFHDFMQQFGFGAKTGIDLPGERKGLLPSRAWKQKALKAPWYPGEMMSVAIGQGYFIATPLQLAMATAIMANKGQHVRPHLFKSAVGPFAVPSLDKADGVVQMTDPSNWDKMQLAMTNVVHGPRGTATHLARGISYTIAGKTGTAQVRGIKQGEKYSEKNTELRFRDHAWFIAFAPADQPKIAVAVLVENGSHGSSTSGPIARALFDYWISGVVPPPPDVKAEEKVDE